MLDWYASLCSFRQRADAGPAGESRGPSASWKVSSGRRQEAPPDFSWIVQKTTFQKTLGSSMKLMLFHTAKAAGFKTNTHEFQVWLLPFSCENQTPLDFNLPLWIVRIHGAKAWRSAFSINWNTGIKITWRSMSYCVAQASSSLPHVGL